MKLLKLNVKQIIKRLFVNVVILFLIIILALKLWFYFPFWYVWTDWQYQYPFFNWDYSHFVIWTFLLIYFVYVLAKKIIKHRLTSLFVLVISSLFSILTMYFFQISCCAVTNYGFPISFYDTALDGPEENFVVAQFLANSLVWFIFLFGITSLCLDKIRLKIKLALFHKISLLLILAILVLFSSMIIYVLGFSKDLIWSSNHKMYTERVAIVFGAKINSDGTLSEALQNRVDTAVKLYQDGKVTKMLFTGDNSQKNYDEVTDMKNYAEIQGVNPDDIKLDYAGFRTYDSCYRAKKIFGVKDAVLVTQKFHLYRALYECNKLGIESVGVVAKDFTGQKLAQAKIREIFAIIQAYWEINVTHPKPKFLGEFEGI